MSEPMLTGSRIDECEAATLEAAMLPPHWKPIETLPDDPDGYDNGEPMTYDPPPPEGKFRQSTEIFRAYDGSAMLIVRTLEPHEVKGDQQFYIETLGDPALSAAQIAALYQAVQAAS